MFQGATKFNNGNKDTIKNWDTTALTNSKNMFNGAEAFDQPIPAATPKWEMKAVTDMEGMFQGAIKLDQAITPWDTTGAKTIKNRDTTALTNSKNMFNGAEAFNQPIPYDTPKWKTTAVTDMEGMFQ